MWLLDRSAVEEDKRGSASLPAQGLGATRSLSVTAGSAQLLCAIINVCKSCSLATNLGVTLDYENRHEQTGSEVQIAGASLRWSPPFWCVA